VGLQPQRQAARKLDTGVDGAFLNDVAIGPDGAAYFTNSNAPQIFRVSKQPNRGWQVTTFVDASATIPVSDGFNLGGIVATPDHKALIVAQGNVGALWRVDLRTRAVTPINIGDANLTNADGLVLDGRKLIVIRNFSRSIATLRLSGNWSNATLLRETPTAPDRVLTTGKLVGRKLYAVDSKFDETVGTPPYEVVVLPKP
jgi:sugar lactone lactonase YvrE